MTGRETDSPSVNFEGATRAERNAALRHIWLCADDYGISRSVNTAIRDLIVRARINATSVMVVAPSFERSEAIPLAILNAAGRRVAIGLHLTLTAPFKPLSSGFQPLADNAFPPLAAALRHANLRRFRRETLIVEIEAQLRAFHASFGHAPDFVDGHQHVHLLPGIRDAVLEVMKDKLPQAWVRQCGRIVPMHRRFGDRKALLLDALSRGFRRRAAHYGVRTNPAFAGTYDFRPDADFAQLFPTFLDKLPEGSVVMCHPGLVDAELKRLDPLTTLREREYAFFGEDSFPGLLAAHGVTLA
jgi:chitin disaccharide deacetylase